MSMMAKTQGQHADRVPRAMPRLTWHHAQHPAGHNSIDDNASHQVGHRHCVTKSSRSAALASFS